MELKTLGKKVKGLTDGGEDRGVSPVIGVILMVAITVILAAVIGAFVLNLGDDLDSGSAPSSQLSLEESSTSTSIEVHHNGGDDIDLADITVIVDGSAQSATFSGGLTAGEKSTLDIGTSGTDLEIQLRHDPSDSILVKGTLTVPT